MTEADNSSRVTVDRERILEIVKHALDSRDKGEGIFGLGVKPPEETFITRLKAYGRNNNIESFALHGVFFTVTSLFADDSAKQLKSFNKRLHLNDHAWIFKPEDIVQRDEQEVIQTAQDLLRPGINKIALYRWQHNAQVLCDKYGGDLKNFFSEYQDHAPAILAELVGPKRKEGWGGFQRFGPKIGRLFLQWVSQYDLATIFEAESIGIPVDFQVARLAIQTGGVKLDGPTHKHHVVDQRLVPLFEDLCRENKLLPSRVSETLWLIGSTCCNNYWHHLCPLSTMCSSLISREPMDRDGLFDPTDVGRWANGSLAVTQRKIEAILQTGQLALPLF